ncbi:MAG: cyclic nucleotide-binding domain-containing protein [Ilumatobacteraceae bacterium]
MIDDVLALTADLPTRTLVAGETLFVAGEESSIVVVLVDGELLVEAGGDALHRHTTPGAFVGETGALLGQPRNATVTATRTTVVREIGHPLEFFLEHPRLGLEVARQLAGRLDRLNAYIADVQRQVGGHDGHLGMFGELLSRIAARPPVHIEPGSDRSPDY